MALRMFLQLMHVVVMLLATAASEECSGAGAAQAIPDDDDVNMLLSYKIDSGQFAKPHIEIINQTPFYVKAMVKYVDGARDDYFGWNVHDEQPAVPPGESAQHGAYRGLANIKYIFANMINVPPDYEIDGYTIPAHALNHRGEIECSTLIFNCMSDSGWKGYQARVEIKPEGYHMRGRTHYCRVVTEDERKDHDFDIDCTKPGLDS
eukprot:TRINITY_DN21942_c0_g1_i2.p1 TRINITY_DN21942_c0_g1~~TRINITY_DN21942_c0_g1_i2.p1  ORF type:complete len:206 (+),score=10.97 TRINITY_DN21942_c0_g1_i2:65-682(+)